MRTPLITLLKNRIFTQKTYKALSHKNWVNNGKPYVNDVIFKLEEIGRKISPKKADIPKILREVGFDASVHYNPSGKPILTAPYDASPYIIAHELGHLFTTIGPENSIRFRPKTINPKKVYDTVQGWIKDELKASAKGLRILRKAGYTPEQISEAREEMKYALRSYKNARDIGTATTILSDGVILAGLGLGLKPNMDVQEN